MAHFLYIANPTAGRAVGKGSGSRLLEASRLDLERHGHTVEIALEPNPARVSEIAERAARDKVPNVVAAGGDGTVNAVVNGLMSAASGRPKRVRGTNLGVLPLGTGNVFAFNLRIGRNSREATRVLRAQNTRAIDVGLARQTGSNDGSNDGSNESRHFVLMAGLGFDAKVIEETSLRLKFVLRDFAYALKSLQNAVVHQGSQVTLHLEGPEGKRQVKEMAWLLIVGNAASYAWDIRVTGQAKLDDGMVDVCLLPYENKLFSVQQAMMMLIGQHVERGTAHYWKTKSVRIEAEPGIPIQLDGDEWGHTPVEIKVLPGALQVLAPPE